MPRRVSPGVRFSFTVALFSAIFGGALPSHATAQLVVLPESVRFDDAYAGRQLLVSDASRDVTRKAGFRSSDPKVVAVDSTGYVAPAGPGTATITVVHAGVEHKVPVTVESFDRSRAVDFASEVQPIMSRLGCNSGGCHGKATGQNGFKLSLFGFDNAFDYDAIVKQARGRRVFAASPAQSLLLRKATAQVAHGGGQRLDPDSESYRLLARWIEAGAPPSDPDAPQIVRLHMSPPDRVMQPGSEQQLAVTAEFSDGAQTDVTRQAQFSSNLDVVATVDEQGLVKTVGQSGQAALMVRHMGHVAVFNAMVPHGESLQDISGFSPNNYIDELALAKWKQLGLTPSPIADDSTFLRRVTLDVCGRLPTIEEAQAFLADTSSDKRAKCIDRLLDSPDYPRFFAMRWGTILRNSNLAGAEQAAYAFHNWMKDSIARNEPYDQFVRGVVAASGEWQDAPAINWYWQMRDDQLHQVTADTAQVFLGVRLQCARCHHHPYEKWGQDDYFGLAGFFTRLGRKSFGEPPPYFASPTPTTGEKNPLTGEVPEPKYLGGDKPKFTLEEDPRHALVDWMAQSDNPFFARTMVNRLWGHFLGRGLVHDVDDMRETNPPSNRELLDALSADFVQSKFDVKHMIRLILNSRVYQLSSEPTEANAKDTQNFARFYARRIIAEVFHDSLDQSLGVRTTFSNMSSNARAIDLPHEGFGSYFLDTFDRPRRVTGCECGRSSSATLAQVLQLANSGEIEDKLANEQGSVATMLAEKRTVPDVVERLYLTSYARRPTPEEQAACTEYVASRPEPRKALEDVLWTIINSKEYMFNH